MSCQGLPLRGHREDAESFIGNFYQLLLLQERDCPEMISRINQTEYISPEILSHYGQMCSAQHFS